MFLYQLTHFYDSTFQDLDSNIPSSPPYQVVWGYNSARVDLCPTFPDNLKSNSFIIILRHLCRLQRLNVGVKSGSFINTIECAVVRLMMTLNSLENRAIPLIEFFSRRKQAMSRSRVLKPGRFKFYQVVLITLQSMDAIEY